MFMNVHVLWDEIEGFSCQVMKRHELSQVQSTSQPISRRNMNVVMNVHEYISQTEHS
jgi:hypothetical protein